MHLIFLNACPNLVAWWTGTFKNIDTTQDHFRISADHWKHIGQRIVESMELIPASFIRQLPDISTLGHTYLAEGWSFWLLHIAPYALDGTLPVVYYNHLLDLASITRRAISYDLTEEEALNTLQDKCTNWVMDYERYFILFFIFLEKCLFVQNHMLTIIYSSIQTILSVQGGTDISMHSNSTCNYSHPNRPLELWPCMGTLGVRNGVRGTVVQSPGQGLSKGALHSSHTQGTPSRANLYHLTAFRPGA